MTFISFTKMPMENRQIEAWKIASCCRIFTHNFASRCRIYPCFGAHTFFVCHHHKVPASVVIERSSRITSADLRLRSTAVIRKAREQSMR